MANIPFKSIMFPGLPNKYTVPEISNDLMTAGKAADAKATGDALSALEDAVGDELSDIKADLGDLSDLKTESKTDLVSAINEAAQSGLSDAAKAALLNCFERVAWVDEHGQDYYDALYQALYDEWDDGYVWLYRPTDGLLSEQSYATLNLIGPDGGAENVIGGVLRLTSPFNLGNTNNIIRYLLTPNTVTAGRLAVKAKIIDTFESSDASGVPGGLFLRLSNGVNGGLYYIGKKGDKIALKIYNGSTGSDNVVVETQIPINEPHIFELELNNSGFKVKIDHADIYTSNTFAGWYVTTSVIGCMGGPYATNGATADIDWCAYYED